MIENLFTLGGRKREIFLQMHLPYCSSHKTRIEITSFTKMKIYFKILALIRKERYLEYLTLKPY